MPRRGLYSLVYWNTITWSVRGRIFVEAYTASCIEMALFHDLQDMILCRGLYSLVYWNDIDYVGYARVGSRGLYSLVYWNISHVNHITRPQVEAYTASWIEI